MEPKDEMMLTFDAMLDWPSGQYSLRLNLMSNGPPTGDEETVLIRGQVVTRAVHLTVTGEPRPEDEGATHCEPPKR